jgi:SEFIR domain
VLAKVGIQRDAQDDHEHHTDSRITMTAPKLFMSYSWSSPAQEARVIGFATELRDSGVDVILDKWDLREGQDAYLFMESMVSDPEVKEVLLVGDSTHVLKADRREFLLM